MTTTQQRCARCGRAAPDQESDEFLEWEPLPSDDPTSDAVICPDCVTPQEETAMAEDMMAVAEKVRENRLRRMAERQGLRLEKSRRRDPRATDFGTYHLVTAADNTLAAWGLSSGYGLSLDDVERALTEGLEAAPHGR